MPRLKGLARLSLGVVVAIALVTGGGAYAYLRPSLPSTSGRLVVAGLEAPLEIVRDRWGIAHIYAQGEDDLFFGQGYVEAQDRLWQMELNRRTARGTLAQVLGEDALASDRLARTLGFARAAEAEWEQMDAASRGVLEAYARGVNAFLAAPGLRLPLEFSLAGLAPEPWRPQDTLAWAQLVAWSWNGDWRAELARARLAQAVGPERAAELEPDLASATGTLADMAPIAAAATLLEDAAASWPWAGGAGLGGASWAVGGARAADGGAILATAPQLAVQMPSPWYELHLVGGRYDVIGATLPGLPGVVLGRNRTLAWGLAGSAVDSMDLYVERVRPGDPPQAEYQGRWEPLDVRHEAIQVRARSEPVRITVYTTRHGPLVSALEPGATEQLALRWAGAGQPAALASCLPALNRAAGEAELQAALDGWAAPALIVPYADAAGSVGYATAGAAPARAGKDGHLPAPGWTGAHEWQGSAAAGVLPGRPAAADALLVAANGGVTPEGWPESPAGGASISPVAARIAELVGAAGPLTLDNAQAIGRDDRGPAQPLLSLLLALPPQGWLQERTTPYLRDWDRRYDAESAGAGIYEAFYWRLVHNTLDDELGADLVDSYLDAYPGHRGAMEALAAQPDSPWFDDLRTPQRERRDDIIARSYADAIDWLGRRFGDLPYEWNWGRVHNVTFRQPLKEGWPLNLLLNRGAMRAGGGPDCVNATGIAFQQRMVVEGVPYSMVVDMAAGGQVVAMNTTGQSGNAISSHFADMIEPWREGQYHPLLYERAAILEAGAATLTLAPSP